MVQKSRKYISHNFKYHFLLVLTLCTFYPDYSYAQIKNANRSGFTWITNENITDNSYGAGYTLYSAAWPTYGEYPGASDFQMGLAGCWLTTQKTGSEPDQFYTTIEGGLGWWGDTRFGKEAPKFIMGGVSFNFYAWANGPGAGRSNNLPSGQRDWSTPGGKYGVAQLSNNLLWAPDGLNIAQAVSGEVLGYGYTPLPITDVLDQTAGQDIETGNQCWTLILNSTNFKGPATFFLPTFWTEPVLEDPSLEGLFLDSRPSDPNVGFGLEHAVSPALISLDSNGSAYAKTGKMQFPLSGEDNSILMHNVSVYSQNALWNAMESWFNGGDVVEPGLNQLGTKETLFTNNGGSLVGEIRETNQGGLDFEMELNFMNNTMQTTNTMGYSFSMGQVTKEDNYYVLPEYYKLESDNKWHAILEDDVPFSTDLISTPVPITPRPETTYLTPLEPDCEWQDPDGPWNSPGPVAGPYTADLGDGSTVTYYWYRFIDQPAIIHANYPEDIREKMQERVELIHTNWSHTDEYVTPPSVGSLATLDPQIIVEPPIGFEIGYVPIVTRQEKTQAKLRVFVLAGQSNMEGHGTIDDPENDPGSLHHVIENDINGDWSEIGSIDNWKTLDDAYIYFANDMDTLRSKITVGQGENSNLIGPELMFAHQLDKYYDDPILIIKTAWGGKNLAEDFRPPSAGGTTGEYYTKMIDRVKAVTENLDAEFPDIETSSYEITGFAWFQGWNDGATDNFLEEYESNLDHLVQDVREDLETPNLPVVIANSGHGGFFDTGDLWVQDMQNIVSVAQENIGCDDETYGGTVGFVDTKPFYLPQEESPLDAIHHFNNNALTYLNIGNEIGEEMILAINDMAYCYLDCGDDLVSPGFVSIGNRVWNDYNKNGINDPFEPGIPDVSVLLWSDSDGDDVPDSQGFGGVRITDENGYYNFSGLEPGNYVTFVWQVNNWGPGEPLEGYVSSDVFEPNADNDIDLDNNGSGNAFTDIFSGIVSLTLDGEPLNDGDLEDCNFDYDSGGNNTIDFGFYNPLAMDNDNDGFPDDVDCDDENPDVNPGQPEIPYNGIDDDCEPETLDDDLDQDGFPLSEDCDDENVDINPDAEEIPNNGIDEDCDGTDLITGTHELANKQIKIYPNPATNHIIIEMEVQFDFSVSIYDLNGRLIKQHQNTHQVQVSSIPPGIYLVEIKDILTGFRVHERIVIMDN